MLIIHILFLQITLGLYSLRGHCWSLSFEWRLFCDGSGCRLCSWPFRSSTLYKPFEGKSHNFFVVIKIELEFLYVFFWNFFREITHHFPKNLQINTISILLRTYKICMHTGKVGKQIYSILLHKFLSAFTNFACAPDEILRNKM